MELDSNSYMFIIFIIANNLNGQSQALTWAQIVNDNGDLGLKYPDNFYKTRMMELNKKQNNAHSDSSLLVKAGGRSYDLHSTHDSYTQALNKRSQLLSRDDSKKFQRRALDFIYHKFVEPKIHQHVEPRPSLLEELVGTFESHVKKDLAAWNQVAAQSPSKRETQKDGDINPGDLEAHSSSPILQVETSLRGKNVINSVANVEEGNAADTFIVTDDSGKKHVITVDEIINSLAQMNENEINNLLIGSPIKPDIERADTFPEYLDDIDGSESFRPIVSGDIQYSRKGVDDDDVILIQSEDGDTRLVTVKDARISAEKQKSETRNKNKFPKYIQPSVNNVGINGLPLNLNDNLHELEEILNVYKQEPNIHPSREAVLNEDNFPPLQILLKQFENNKNINNHQNLNIKAQENKDREDLEYLIDLKENKEKNEQFLVSPSASVVQGVTAPNSPPLKVINTEDSLIDLLPFQSSVSIRSNTPPIMQKTGIRKRLSNFFSRLVGKSVTDVNISKNPGEELDEFVQIVMPRSDSKTMEQITIPLPKAIHHKGGRNIQAQISAPQKSKRKQAERRSSTVPEQTNSKGSKTDLDSQPSSNVAESILQAAKVPEKIKEKILAQIKDKPKFLQPQLHEETYDQIDRRDTIFKVKNKAVPKDIQFPIGYEYEIPAEFEGYDPYPGYEYYAPQHGKEGKGKKKGDDDKQPLLDINLLTDLVLLSRDGDDNNSFTFPKIGDASKFVDVRKNIH